MRLGGGVPGQTRNPPGQQNADAPGWAASRSHSRAGVGQGYEDWSRRGVFLTTGRTRGWSASTVAYAATTDGFAQLDVHCASTRHRPSGFYAGSLTGACPEHIARRTRHDANEVGRPTTQTLIVAGQGDQSRWRLVARRLDHQPTE